MTGFPSKSVVNMSGTELFQHVRRIARDSKRIRFSDHTKWERMPQRAISLEDISKILTMGTMPGTPAPGRKDREMTCRFEGKSLDYGRVAVVVAVRDSSPNVLVITVIRLSS